MMFSMLIKVPPRYSQRPRSAKSAEMLKETKTTVVPVIILLQYHHITYIYTHLKTINLVILTIYR